MRKICVLTILFLITILSTYGSIIIRAESTFDVDTEIYSVYDSEFNLLFQKDLIEIGYQDEINEGKAVMYTVLENELIEPIEITITKKYTKFYQV